MQGVQIPQTQRQGNPADDPGTRVRHHGCYVKKDTRNEKRKDHCNIPDSACDSMFRPTWRCIRDTRIHVGEGCVVGGAEFYPASLILKTLFYRKSKLLRILNKPVDIHAEFLKILQIILYDVMQFFFGYFRVEVHHTGPVTRHLQKRDLGKI